MTDPTFDPGAVTALLFDLGGVVVDIDFSRCFGLWAEGAGRDADDLAARFVADAAYEAHERGELDEAGYFASLRTTLGLALSDDEMRRGWTDIYVGPSAGVVPLLRAAAAAFPLHAFTNTNPSHVAVWSQAFARELALFTSVFVSSDLGRRKPEREAFRVVAERMGVPEAAVLFFDDSPENVHGARAAGMQAVEVRSTADIATALDRLDIALPAA